MRTVRARARRASWRCRGQLRMPHDSALPHLTPLVPSAPPRRVRAPLPLWCTSRTLPDPSARARARRTPWRAEHATASSRATSASPRPPDRTCITPSLTATSQTPPSGPRASPLLSPPPCHGAPSTSTRYKSTPALPHTRASPQATAHKHGSALPRRGRGRSRPGHASLPLPSLYPSHASPLHTSSPAVFCPCFMHSSAAEDSPDLEHGRGG